MPRISHGQWLSTFKGLIPTEMVQEVTADLRWQVYQFSGGGRIINQIRVGDRVWSLGLKKLRPQLDKAVLKIQGMLVHQRMKNSSSVSQEIKKYPNNGDGEKRAEDSFFSGNVSQIKGYCSTSYSR